MAEGLDSISLSANWMWPCRAQEGEDARLYLSLIHIYDVHDNKEYYGKICPNKFYKMQYMNDD